MRWPAVVTVLAAGAIFAGCDRLPFFGGGEADSVVTDTAAVAGTPAQPVPAQPAPPRAATTPDSTPPEPRTTPPQRAQRAPPSAAAQERPAPARSVSADQPWTPRFTGTVDPGMSTDEVIATWGPPVAQRTVGTWTYLYFRNGCEFTCGTFDVVFLQDGQVVDAIVRGQGHTYSGVSSSPAGQAALYTPPGATTMNEGREG